MGKFYLSKTAARKNRRKGQRVIMSKEKSGRVVFKLKRRKK